MKKSLNFVWISLLIVWMSGCTSTQQTRPGVQSEFLALNPSLIAAFPPVIMPHPSESTSLDPAALMTSNLQSAVETRILSAFKNQPNVNGISFQTVRTLLKASDKLANDIDSELKSVGQLANSGAARETLLLSSECRNRRNFLDFYKFCLLQSPKWVPLLNRFSTSVQNSDSILIPVITSLEKATEKDIYFVKFGVALLLVDTNSGRLIWGRDSIVRLDSPAGVKQFSEVTAAVDKTFNESFWAEFPGRRSKQEQNK
ncbi:hypothetical protein EBU99_04215 [bacterium]|nr:hypothetical protein [bacterium]